MERTLVGIGRIGTNNAELTALQQTDGVRHRSCRKCIATIVVGKYTHVVTGHTVLNGILTFLTLYFNQAPLANRVGDTRVVYNGSVTAGSVGNVLGISYGAAVMTEMMRTGRISRHEADEANYHLIMNHSMIEDTLVYAALGIPPALILSVRIVFALIVVWTRKFVVCVLRRG